MGAEGTRERGKGQVFICDDTRRSVQGCSPAK